MSDEIICGEGHVIDAGLERCARCNGLPVVNGEAVDLEVPAVVEETIEEESPKVEEEAPSVSSDESSDALPAAPAEEAKLEDQPVGDQIAPEQQLQDNEHVAEGAEQF